MRTKAMIAAMSMTLMAGFLALPASAPAQRWLSSHRQHMKNDWRNMAYLGAGTTLIGALNHDPTLTFLGAAGTLYSANRYEQDRRSQNDLDRERAYYFSRGSYDYNGHHYRRYETDRDGNVYYYFRRDPDDYRHRR